MLNDAIAKRFEESLANAKNIIQAEGGAYLLVTDENAFRAERALHEEIFGPATLLVKCENADKLIELAGELDGQLTATIHAEPEDEELSGRLLRVLQEKAGRIVWNSYPTGVEVCSSMHHGGPYPATTTAGSLPSARRPSIVLQDQFLIKGSRRSCYRSSYETRTSVRSGEW